MKKVLKTKITNKGIQALVDIINKSRKALTVIGIVGMIWGYVPWRQIQAETVGLPETEYIEEIPTEEQNVTQLPDYPTTTDPDFDPSQVEIESEVIDERTETTKTFRKIDGTYEIAMYNDVIHYLENGEYKQVNNSLVDLGTEYENLANKFKLKFPKKLDDNKQIKLSMDGYSIDWKVLNITSSDIEYDDTEITPSNIKELVNINQSVLYRNIQPNVDIEYILTGSKVKENIILNQYVQDFSMTFEYKLKDLEIIEDVDGNILFVNDNNETVFIFNDLFMIDNDSNESFDIDFSFIETGNKTYEITITPNDEWLQSAVYPVEIDPSISIDNSNNNIDDKHTFPTNGEEDDLNYNIVGYYNSRVNRTYLEIELDEIPTDSIVTYSHLKMNSYGTNKSCTNDCNIVVKEVNSSETFVGINGIDDITVDRIIDFKLISNTDSGDSNYYWDITRTLQNWLYSNRNSGILELSMNDETSSNYVMFDSRKHSGVTVPTIEIGYQYITGIRDYWTYNSQPVGDAGTGYISDYTGNLTFARTDYARETERGGFGLSFTYNVSDQRDLTYGNGWRSNYDVKLVKDTVLDKYYTIDGTGAIVYYHYSSTFCGDRENDLVDETQSQTAECRLAEDGSRNLLIFIKDSSGNMVSQFVLSLNQIYLYFTTTSTKTETGKTYYSMSHIYEGKKSKYTKIVLDSSNSYRIDEVQEKLYTSYGTQDNIFDFVYNAQNQLDYVDVKLYVDSSTDSTVERIDFQYVIGYDYLQYVYYKTNYDGTSLTTNRTIEYDYDANWNLETAESSLGDKVKYTYDNNDRVDKVEMYVNDNKIGETNYDYSFKSTTITDHNNEYVKYSFDNYGHTVQVLNNEGTTQIYRYLNLFSNSGTTQYNPVYKNIDGTFNYRNNHKLYFYSKPITTENNLVRDYSFEETFTTSVWSLVNDYLSNSSSAKSSFSHLGDSSYYVEVSASTNSHLEQTVVLDKGFYTLGGYVYANTTGTDVSLGVSIGEKLEGFVTTTQTWEYIETYFYVSSDNTSVDLELKNFDDGRAYFDNITLSQGFGNSTVNLLENSGFENSNNDWTMSSGVSIVTTAQTTESVTVPSELDTVLGNEHIEINGNPDTEEYMTYDLTDYIDVSLGKQYVFGAWVNSFATPNNIDTDTTEERYFRMELEYVLTDQTSIVQNIDFDPTVDDWNALYASLIIPADVQSLLLHIRFKGMGNVYVDAIQIYESGFGTTSVYNSAGNISTVYKLNGEEITLSFQETLGKPENNSPTDIDTDNSTTDIEYNDNYTVDYVIRNNVKVNFNYNSKKQVSSTDYGDLTEVGFTTSTQYLSTSYNQYVSGNTDEFGESSTYSYSLLTGLLSSYENALNKTTSYTYENNGYLHTVTADDYCIESVCASVEYKYNQSTNLLDEIVISSGLSYHLVYDSYNRLEYVKMNTTNLMQFDYYIDGTYETGLISEKIYGNLDEMEFSYDSDNQLSSICFKNYGDSTCNTRFSYGYDATGKLTSYTTHNKSGTIISVEYYVYDNFDRLTKIYDDDGNAIEYAYDEYGNLDGLDFTINDDEHSVNYFYNKYMSFTGDSNPFNSTLYDKTEYTTQDNKEVSRSYIYENSALYRLNHIELQIDLFFIKKEFGYVGDTTRISTISYDYGASSSTNDYDYIYDYDELGNIVEIIYKESGVSKTTYNYEYDELNQLIVEDVFDHTLSNCDTVADTCYSRMFYYDLQGNITESKTFLYGERDTVTTVIPSPSSTNNGTEYMYVQYNGSYSYDDMYEIPLNSTFSMTYTYYENFTFPPVEITRVGTNCSASNVDTSVAGYYEHTCTATKRFTGYNLTFTIIVKVGNPTSTMPNTPIRSTSYSYSTYWEDQLSSYTITNESGTTTYNISSYDNQGNPLIMTNFYYNGVEYDHAHLEWEGRELSKIIVHDSSHTEKATISYIYNDQGYRTSKTIVDKTTGTTQTTTTTYHLNGNKVLYETDGTNDIIYTYDYDGTLISFNYNGTEYFYLTNLQGDITKIVDSSGNVIVEYHYDAWGNIIKLVDNSTSNIISSINPYTYRGYRYDSEINLYYLNSRYYNSNIGRFINADGLLGEQGVILSHNLYSYVMNNGIMNIDVEGFAPSKIIDIFKLKTPTVWQLFDPLNGQYKKLDTNRGNSGAARLLYYDIEGPKLTFTQFTLFDLEVGFVKFRQDYEKIDFGFDLFTATIKSGIGTELIGFDFGVSAFVFPIEFEIPLKNSDYNFVIGIEIELFSYSKCRKIEDGKLEVGGASVYGGKFIIGFEER